MELTLLPIAAILLLLSGLSAPTRSAVRQGSPAAFMRELFGARPANRHLLHRPELSSRALAHYLDQQQVQQQVQPRFQQLRSGPSRLAQSLSAPQSQQTSGGGSGPKLLRSRFSSPDGVYLATAPPVC